MNILRLSTLSLTLAIAVMTLGYNPSFADKPTCGGQHCNHGDDPSAIEYTAVLTGAFVFNEVVTANSKETELRSQDDVQLFRDRGSDSALWDFVFAQCPEFFLPTVVDVPSFTAPSDGKGWTINKEGGVSVAFRKIPFDVPDGPVEVNLYLNGTTPYEDDFLPVFPAATIMHPLSRFAIWGQTVKGGTPGLKCHSETGVATFPMGSELALTITRN